MVAVYACRNSASVHASAHELQPVVMALGVGFSLVYKRPYKAILREQNGQQKKRNDGVTHTGQMHPALLLAAV